jgi:hypothetical protein
MARQFSARNVFLRLCLPQDVHRKNRPIRSSLDPRKAVMTMLQPADNAIQKV